METENKIKIAQPWGYGWAGKVLKFLYFLFVRVGLKKQRKFWGIVYDSRTKQPIDPAVVQLVKTGSVEIETCITDIAGRYGFLASPGRYKIVAKKQNYIFPSKIAENSSDGIYSDLYHGEFIEIKGGSEVLAPNIPMDSSSEDWNQSAKQKYIKTYPIFAYLSKQAVKFVFWLASATAALLTLWYFFKTEQIAYGPFVFFIICLLILLLANFLPEEKLYGRVFDTKTGGAIEGIFLEMFNPKLPSAVLGRAVTNFEGKYFLRANPGDYFIVFSMRDNNKNKIELGQVAVSLGSQGYVNNIFYINLSNG